MAKTPLGSDFPLSLAIDEQGRYLVAHLERGGAVRVNLRSIDGTLIREWPVPEKFRLEGAFLVRGRPVMLSKDGVWLAITGDGPGDSQEAKSLLESEAAWLLTDAAGEHVIAVDPVSGHIHYWNSGRVRPSMALRSPSIDLARYAFMKDNDSKRAKGVRARSLLVVMAAVNEEGTIATVASGWKPADGMPLDLFKPDGTPLASIRLAPPLRPDGRPLGLNGMQFHKDRVWIADSAGTVHGFTLTGAQGGVQ